MENKYLNISRRDLLKKRIWVTSGVLFFNPKSLLPYQEQKIQLWSEFNPEEIESVQHSEMANRFKSYLGERKYNCSELIFLTCLKCLDLPENYSYAAAGYGGGLEHGDLCGFLTGGIMGIGVAAKTKFENREEAKEFINYARDEYWNWFSAMAPIKCIELKEKYKGTEQFLRMGQRLH